jgi:flagellar basal body rod protein FlgG
VSVVKELVDLITVTRLYEANAKSIKAHDERMKNILQVAMG